MALYAGGRPNRGWRAAAAHALPIILPAAGGAVMGAGEAAMRHAQNYIRNWARSATRDAFSRNVRRRTGDNGGAPPPPPPSAATNSSGGRRRPMGRLSLGRRRPYRRSRAAVRRRRVVRRVKKRLLGTRPSRFGRVRRITSLYRRTPAPIATTTLSFRNAQPINLSMYRYQRDPPATAVTNLVHAWVIRANDIVHPVENNLSCYQSNGSAQALEEHARYYIRHQVMGFRYKAKIRLMYTSPSDAGYQPFQQSGASSAKTPGLVMGYVGWRILNACPDNMNIVPAGDAYKRIVQGQEPGWRYKRFNTPREKQFFLNIDTGYIPSTKFYHAPFMSQQLETENITQDLANALTWTGPTDKTFIQFCIFSDGIGRFIGEPGTIGPDGVVVGNNEVPFHLQAGMDHRAYYRIRSYERRGEQNDSSETTYTPCTDPNVTLPDLGDGALDEVFVEQLEP